MPRPRVTRILPAMDDLDAADRGPAKRDRTARLMRVASLLNAHPEGMRPKDIAERLGMSVRNVYRDLKALEGEVGLPTWSEEGRWGILESAFLPPLKLNLSEAMAVFLGARLMVRYADKYDPDLGLGVREARGQPAGPAPRACRPEPRRPPGRAPRPGVHRARPAADAGLGGSAGRRDRRTRARAYEGRAGRARRGASSGRT